MAGELEADSVALERIREYEALPQEREWKTDFPLSKVKIFLNMTFQDKSFTGESLTPLEFNVFSVMQYLQKVSLFSRRFALHISILC